VIPAEPTAWTAVKSLPIVPGKPGNYILRILTPPRAAGTVVVDAEIRCTKEQADALDELLKRRITGAGAPEASGSKSRSIPLAHSSTK
jgi:hypothetical protein